MLKLLDKKDIVAIKAKERQVEVNEGVKLAKRVDALREIQAEEEKSLSDFRDKTIKQIHSDIAMANKELSHVQGQVKQTKADLADYEQSLERRQTKLDEEEKLLSERWSLFHEERDKLDACAKIIKQTSLDIEDDKIRIAGELETATQQRIDAGNMSAEAKDNLALARVRIAEAERKEAQVRQLTEDQARFLTSWEQSLKDKEEALRLKDYDLINREIRLRDQYVALEQAQNHVKRSLPRRK